MEAKDVQEAETLLRQLRKIDKALGVERRAAEVRVVTRTDLGQDFTTEIVLPDPHWRDALRAFETELVGRLEAMGVHDARDFIKKGGKR